MKHVLMNRRILQKLIIIVLIAVLFWTYFQHSSVRRAKKCFQKSKETDPTIEFFADLMESEKKPNPGKTIFFHETSCSGNGLVHLTHRQSCAIESAAKFNPDWDVFVLFASPRGLHNESIVPIPSVIQALQSYPNIHLRNINLWSYSMGTPLHEWLHREQIFHSKYLSSHMSDFLRYLSLYKFGGTYLDLDVVVQRSFNTIPPNFAGAESDEYIAAGIINFDHDGIGHEIAEMCVREFIDTFDGDYWGQNGPGVITRVLRRICHVGRTSLMQEQSCLNFKVYPPSTFYAVPFTSWKLFFDTSALHQTLHMTNSSIAVHIWNKLSADRKIKVGSKSAYGAIAENNCPRVYNSAGEYF